MTLQEVLDIVKNSHIVIKSLVTHNGLTHVEVPLKSVLKDKSVLKREVLHFKLMNLPWCDSGCNLALKVDFVPFKFKFRRNKLWIEML